MSTVKSFHDLIAWQKSMALAKRIYGFTECFPRKELYGLTSQIRRAAVSVPANIAEGHERQTTGEFCQFLGIAKGSLGEVETLILLARDMGYGDTGVADVLILACREIGRLLNGLLKSLTAKK
jgi:four helix bundle protein